MPNLKLKQRNGVWQVSGTVAGQRVRQSLGCRDKGQAEELRADLEARLWKRHTYGEEAVRTFEEAVIVYVNQGGEARFLEPILRHFKGRSVGSIQPGEVREAAIALHPNSAPATRNRQVIAPASAVLNAAHAMGWRTPIRVPLFPVRKSQKHKPVTREWLNAFMAQADVDGLPHLSGIVLFMNQTGARRSEAVRLLGEHVDLSRRVVALERTKTEDWSIRHLTQELCLRIAALAPQEGQPVFRYTDPTAVNRRIQAVCKRAGIEYRSTHSAGRHSFGTNAMASGATVKGAMQAGGWKSARLFLETYVHADDEGADLARKLDHQTGITGTDMAHAKPTQRYHFGKKGIK